MRQAGIVPVTMEDKAKLQQAEARVTGEEPKPVVPPEFSHLPPDGGLTYEDKLEVFARQHGESWLKGASEQLGGWDGGLLESAAEIIGPTDEQEFALGLEEQDQQERIARGEIDQAEALGEDIGDALLALPSQLGPQVLAAAGGQKLGSVLAGPAGRILPGRLGKVAGKALQKGGAFMGGISAMHPVMYQSAVDTAIANGEDPDDPEVQARIAGYALVGGIAQTVTPMAIVRKWLPDGGAALMRQPLMKAVAKGATPASLKEAYLEVGDVALQALYMDPELRKMLSEDDREAILPYYAERYGRDSIIGFAAGGVGAAVANAPGEAMAQRAENLKQGENVRRLAVSLEPLGLDSAKLAEKVKTPGGAADVSEAVNEVGASEFQRSSKLRDLDRTATTSKMPDEVKQAAVEDARAEINAEADAVLDKYAEKLGAPMRTKDLAERRKLIEDDTRKEAVRALKETGITPPNPETLDPAVANAMATELAEARSAVDRLEARTKVTANPELKTKARTELAEARARFTKARVDAKARIEGLSGADAVKAVQREDADRDAQVRRVAQRESREKAVEQQREAEFPETMPPEAQKAKAEEMVAAAEKDPTATQKGLDRKIARLEGQRRAATTPEEIDKINDEIADLGARRGLPTPAVEAARRVLQDQGVDLEAAVEESSPDTATARQAGLSDPDAVGEATQSAGPEASVAAEGPANPWIPDEVGRAASTPELKASANKLADLQRKADDSPEGMKALQAFYDGPEYTKLENAFDRDFASKNYPGWRTTEEADQITEAPWADMEAYFAGIREGAEPEAPARAAGLDDAPVLFDDGDLDDDAAGVVSAQKDEGKATKFGYSLPLSDGGNDPVDLTAQFQDVKDQRELVKRMSDWTNETGFEMAAHVDSDGNVIAAVTNNHENLVAPPRKGHKDPDVTFVHTHTQMTPMSVADVNLAMRNQQPNMAILPDGSITEVVPMTRLSAEELRSLQSVIYDDLWRAGAIYQGIDPVDRARLMQEAQLQALEAAGAVQYRRPFRKLKPNEKDHVNGTIERISGPIGQLQSRIVGRQRAEAALTEADFSGDTGGAGIGVPDARTDAEQRASKAEQSTANPVKVRQLATEAAERAVTLKSKGGDPHFVKFVKDGVLDEDSINAGLHEMLNNAGNKKHYMVYHMAERMFPDHDFSSKSFTREHTQERYKGDYVPNEATLHRVNAALYLFNDIVKSDHGGMTSREVEISNKWADYKKFKVYFSVPSISLRNWLEFSTPDRGRLRPRMIDPNDTSQLKQRPSSNLFSNDALEPAARTARAFQSNEYGIDSAKLETIRPPDMMSSKKLGEEGIRTPHLERFERLYAMENDGVPIPADDQAFLESDKGRRIREKWYAAEGQIGNLKQAVKAYKQEHGDKPVGFLYQVDDKGRIYANGDFNPQSTDAVKKIFTVNGTSLGAMPTMDASASGWQIAALMARDDVAAPNVNMGKDQATEPGFTKNDLYTDTVNRMRGKIEADANDPTSKNHKIARLVHDTITGNPAVPIDRNTVKSSIIAVNYGAKRGKFSKSFQKAFGPIVEEIHGVKTPIPNMWGYMADQAYTSIKEVAPHTMAFQEWALDGFEQIARAVEAKKSDIPAKLTFTVGLDGTFGAKRQKTADGKIRFRTSNQPVYELDANGKPVWDDEKGIPKRLDNVKGKESTITHTVKIKTDEVDFPGLARTLWSQLVQGFDASVLHRTVERYRSATDNAFITTNHDAFTVPSGHESDAAGAIRESLREVMGRVDVPRRLYDEIMSQASLHGVLDKIDIQPFDKYGNYELSTLDTATPVFVEQEMPDGTVRDDDVPVYGNLPEQGADLARGTDEAPGRQPRPPEAGPVIDPDVDGGPTIASAMDMYSRVQDDLTLDNEYVDKPSRRESWETTFKKYSTRADPLSLWERFNRYRHTNTVSDQYGLKTIERDLGTEEAVVMDGMSKMVQMLTNEGSRVNSMLYYAVPQFNAEQGVYEANPNAKPLAEILQLRDTKDYDQFGKYAYARRDASLIERGKDPRIVDDLREKWLDIPDADAARYEEMLSDYRDFNNAMLDEAKDSGLLSQAQVDALKEDGEYVPMFRVFDDAREFGLDNFFGKSAGLSHPDPGIKSLKDNPLKIGETIRDDAGNIVARGGKFGDLVENMQRNAVGMLLASTQNRAHARIYDFLTGELGHEVQDIKTKAGIEAVTLKEGDKKESRNIGERDAMAFYKDGNKVYWKAKGSPADTYGLVQAIAGLQPAHLNMIERTLRAYNGFRRTVITSTPTFAMRSLIRDMGQGFIQTGSRPDKMAKEGVKKLFENTKRYSDATKDLMLGAGVGAWHLGGTNEFRASDIRGGGVKGLARLDAKTIRKTWQGYEAKVGSGDLAARQAVYDRVIAKGGSKADAMYEARNHIDYGRKGASRTLKAASYSILFLNPRIQGLYRIFESSGADRAKRIAGLGASLMVRGLLYTAIGSYLPRIATYMIPPEEGEEINEWEKKYRGFTTAEKAQYVHIPLPWTDPARFLRIPRPFELGTVFGSIPVQAGFDSFISDTPAADMAAMMAHTFVNTFSFNPTPEIALPWVEAFVLNKSVYNGVPIVPRRLEGLPSFMQKDERTGGIAQEVGGAIPKIAPVQVQFLANSILGPLGMYAYDAVEAILANTGMVNPKGVGPSGYVAKVAPIGGDALERVFGFAFTKTEKEGATRFGNEFYELHNNMSKFAKGFDEAKAAREVDALKRFMENEGAPQLRGLRKRFETGSKKISGWRKKMRAVSTNESMPEEQRREAIENYRGMIARQQRGLVEMARKAGLTPDFVDGLIGNTSGVNF